MVDTQKVSNIAEGDIDFESGGPAASKNKNTTPSGGQMAPTITMKGKGQDQNASQVIEVNQNVRELVISPSMQNKQGSQLINGDSDKDKQL